MRLSRADHRLLSLISSLRALIARTPTDADLGAWLVQNRLVLRASPDVVRFVDGGAQVALAEPPARKRKQPPAPPLKLRRGGKK